MTSSNTFQSDIGSFQNGGHGEDIINARLELFMYNLSIFRLLAFFLFYFYFFITDRPTHFHETEGDGKQNILWGWPYTEYNINSLSVTYPLNTSTIYIYLRV